MSSESLSNSLFRDLDRLYNNANDYDVIIQVGEGSNSEVFKAHSNILRIRSTYFNAALSSNWVKKEGNVIEFKKPNINPDVFRVILKYIYTGTVALDTNIVDMNLAEILVAADEINLGELVDYIQKYIINQDLSENFVIKLFNILSCHREVFRVLYEFFEELICNNPKRFLYNSNLFSELEKDALLLLIQNDNFQMEEIEIWDNLLKWAIAKNPTINIDTSFWKTKEIEVIKETIHQFIPYVRFFQISLHDYYYKICPLSALLPKELGDDLNLHFLVPENPENHREKDYLSLISKVLPPRISPIGIDSEIIKMDHIYQVSHWIDRKQGRVHHLPRGLQYEFKLLLRGSRDGFEERPFKRKCYNKGATLVVIKLKDEDKIIGGYNPINWRGSGVYISTSDSFIFSFQSILNSSTTILSRVKNKDKAIHDSMYYNHGFGSPDLRIFNNIYEHKVYENRIIETSSFKVEDYEVFQIVKKKTKSKLTIY